MASQYRFQKTVTNVYLGKQKIIKANTRKDLEMLADSQLRIWAEQERNHRERIQKQEFARHQMLNTQQQKQYAEHLTREIQNQIDYLTQVISRCSNEVFWVSWNSIYSTDEYMPFTYFNPPTLEDAERIVGGIPDKSITEMLLSSKRELRERQQAAAMNQYQNMLFQYNLGLEKSRIEYEKNKSEFLARRDTDNKRLYDISRSTIEDKEKFSVFLTIATDLFCKIAFDDISVTPSVSDNGSIVLFDLELMRFDDFPSVKGYRYVASQEELETVSFKKGEREALYETYIFSTVIALFRFFNKQLNEKGVQSISVNVWITDIDRKTGHEKTCCVLSVQALCGQIAEINFLQVNPKECIRGLKGIYAGALCSLTPVNPILSFNKDDPRFIVARDVIAELDPHQNLAIMDWQDFEHLIRELFGKLFGDTSGGEVKITRASRDAGVDAIAFDPDPIRGGKFVIQAKRYNNTVGVNAVRDLYGTMINEGAARGILVTTSSFGSDSYGFAKDKPITLIDGQKLLGLLQNYGYGDFNISLGIKK